MLGGNNRTTVIRIPDTLPEYKRIEYRVAPASCKPESAILLILAGVFHGIKHRLKAPPRIWGNASDERYNLDDLPSSRKQAQGLYFTSGNVRNYINSFTLSKGLTNNFLPPLKSKVIKG